MSAPEHPAPLDPSIAAAVASLDENAREFFEERAAIIEYDGGVPRIEAERRALKLTRAWLRRRRVDGGGNPP